MQFLTVALISALSLAAPQSTPRLATGCTGKVVTVQSGDTTWNLVNANAPGTPMQKVVEANPQLSNIAMIFPGDQLCIPDCPIACSGTLYTFQSGDSVWNLITNGPFQGLTLDQVHQANPQIKDLGFILVGQKVCFPVKNAYVA